MRERIENLTFWDFLEAIVRVAQQKAMPTDEEVEEYGYADGGEFLLRLKDDDPGAYRDFIELNERQWWERTRQPIDKKISIMLTLVMRTLAANLKRWEKDGTAAEARKKAADTRDYVKRHEGLAAPPGSALPDKPTEFKGNELLEGLGTFSDDGTLSMDAMMSLDSALDAQTRTLDRAATTIQARSRGRMARVDLAEKRNAAKGMQRYARGICVRKAVATGATKVGALQHVAKFFGRMR